MQRLRHWYVFVLAFALLPVTLGAQDRATVSGTITAENSGQPLAGAQVSIPSTTSRAVSDDNGRFALLNVPQGTHTLRVTRLGFRPVSREISVGTNGATVTIAMESDPLRLEEMVVTGYGEERRRNISGAIGSLRLEETVKDVPLTSVNQALQGRVAGVQVVQNAGNPGNAITVRVRGSSSISGGNDPLYVIDGIPMIQGDASSLNVGFGGQDVDAVSILSMDRNALIFKRKIFLLTVKARPSSRQNFSLMISKENSRASNSATFQRLSTTIGRFFTPSTL